MMRGYLDEWELTHRAVLDRDDPRVLLSLATLRRVQDRNGEALPLLRRAYRMFRASGDALGVASAALSWAVCGLQGGRLRLAQAAMRVVLAALDSVGPDEPLRGYALMTLRGPLCDLPEDEPAT